jgi:hypothetical protein
MGASNVMESKLSVVAQREPGPALQDLKLVQYSHVSRSELIRE